MVDAGVVEVYADVCCPFTHVGLVRFVQAREERGGGPVLHVRSWPLELVNGRPLDPAFIAEEVEEIRQQVAPLTCSPASGRRPSRPARSRPWPWPLRPTGQTRPRASR